MLAKVKAITHAGRPRVVSRASGAVRAGEQAALRPAGRADRPRLRCSWHVSEATGRLECRWSCEDARPEDALCRIRRRPAARSAASMTRRRSAARKDVRGTGHE